jgi:hypothetical protein
VSQAAIFGFGVVVFFLGGLGLVLIGLDAFRSWSRDDTSAGEPLSRAAAEARLTGGAEDAEARRGVEP